MAKHIPEDRISLTSWQREASAVIDEHAMTVLQGEAGCGKTFVAMYYGTEAIKAGKYERLVVVRSPLESGRSRMGFLPGGAGADEKMAPWAAPILEIAKDLKWGKEITILPTCYVQGLTFKNAFVIIDECQNMDITEWESVVTRLGKDSRVVLAGDWEQDTRNMNGMRPFLDATDGVIGLGYYEFPEEANCRHPLVRDITRALRAYRNRNSR